MACSLFEPWSAEGDRDGELSNQKMRQLFELTGTKAHVVVYTFMAKASRLEVVTWKKKSV